VKGKRKNFIKYLQAGLMIIVVTLSPGKLFAQNTLGGEGAEGMFNSGLNLYDSKNLTAARAVFEDYTDRWPGAEHVGSARYYTASCALMLYHKDGEKLIEQFIADYPYHPKTVIAYFELGSFYYRSKKYVKSVEFLEKVDLSNLTTNQKNEALFMLGYGYFSDRKFDQAIKHFDQLKRGNSPYASSSSYYAGYIEFESGQYDAALTDLTRVEKNATYQREVPYMKASALYKKKDYETLLSYTAVLLKEEVNYSNMQTLYLLAGEALYHKQRYAEALSYYEEYRLRMKNRIDEEVRYRMAYSRYQTGDKEGAIEDFEMIAGKGTETALYASYYLGVLYLETGNKRYALTAFDEVRSNDINSGLREDGAYQYARLQYDLGNSGQAITAMEDYLAAYPSGRYFNEINELLSEAYLTTNDYKKAIQHIEKLPRKTKAVETAYQKATFLLGAEYFNRNDYPRAVDMFETSLRYPYDREYIVRASFWSAEAYSVGLRYEQAIQFYQKIVFTYASEVPELFLRARYGLGYSYFNTGEYDKARVQFREFTIAKNTELKLKADALVRLADCYYVSKEYPEAIKYYREALAINRVDVDYIRLHLGLVSVLQGKGNTAHQELDIVIARGIASRYYDDALFNKAQLYFDQTLYNEAIALYTRLMEELPLSTYVPLSLMRRAAAYYNKQQYEPAIADYVNLIENHTTHKQASEALLPLQDVLNMLNRSEDFTGYLATFKKANPDTKGLETVEFEASKNQYFSQDYQKAITGLKAFIDTYPDDPRVTEAMYYIADASHRLGNAEEARRWFVKVAQNKAFWQYPKVVEKLAELEREEHSFAKANNYYSELAGLASNKRQENVAWTGKMICNFELGKYDSSIYYSEKLLQSANMSINTESEATLYLGKSFYAKGNYDQAKDEFLHAINTAKDENGAEAQYLLGEVFYQSGDYRQSIEMLIDLNKLFPSYTAWVGKGFLLIADNYIALEDFFQARGTLNSLIEHFPLEQIKEQARTRLLSLDQLEQETDSVGVLEKIPDVSPSDSLNNNGN